MRAGMAESVGAFMRAGMAETEISLEKNSKLADLPFPLYKIGRASCRERV